MKYQVVHLVCNSYAEANEGDYSYETIDLTAQQYAEAVREAESLGFFEHEVAEVKAHCHKARKA